MIAWIAWILTGSGSIILICARVEHCSVRSE